MSECVSVRPDPSNIDHDEDAMIMTTITHQDEDTRCEPLDGIEIPIKKTNELACNVK